MPVLVGTSGWQYRDWRGRLYPQRLAQARWLEHYAERFATVESNNAFYRLPVAGELRRLGRADPARVRLRGQGEPLPDPPQAAARPRGAGRPPDGPRPPPRPEARPDPAPAPPTLKADPAALDRTLRAFPAGARVAVEPRHDSWWTDEVRDLLASARGRPVPGRQPPPRHTPVWRTADWTYLRLHEGRADPRPCYDRQALAAWADRLAGLVGPDADAYVYFNNDPGGCAVRDAVWFAEEATAAGLHPTRVPDPWRDPGGLDGSLSGPRPIVEVQMRDLIVTENITLDGVVDASAGWFSAVRLSLPRGSGVRGEEIARAGLAVGRWLAREGVLGRAAVDFVAVKGGDCWQSYALEINLRCGGTTHLLFALTSLTDGVYDRLAAEWRTRLGDLKYYAATDHLDNPAYTSLTPGRPARHRRGPRAGLGRARDRCRAAHGQRARRGRADRPDGDRRHARGGPYVLLPREGSRRRGGGRLRRSAAGKAIVESSKRGRSRRRLRAPHLTRRALRTCARIRHDGGDATVGIGEGGSC